MSHVIRTPLSRSKGQRSRSPGRFTHRGVNASGCCRGERGNVLAVGTYCYVAVCTLQARSARRREALRRPRREERGGDILLRPPAYSLLNLPLHLAAVGCTLQWTLGAEINKQLQLLFATTLTTNITSQWRQCPVKLALNFVEMNEN